MRRPHAKEWTPAAPPSTLLNKAAEDGSVGGGPDPASAAPGHLEDDELPSSRPSKLGKRLLFP